jgi:putative heme-binding domain-containing protein
LLDLLLPGHPPLVQAAAARGLATLDQAVSSRGAYERWSLLGLAARQEILAAALRTRSATEAVLEALERQVVMPSELPAVVRSGLAQLRDAQLKERAAKVLAAAQSADRPRVVAKYQNAIRMSGDQGRGAALFKQHCLACHVIQGTGVRVGPDLSGVGSRRNDILLVDILDPSRNVTPDFTSYIAATKQGQVLTGLISAETRDTIVLRRAGGEVDVVVRDAIEELRSTGKSLMPDGIEEQLGLQQLADVLEFLRRPDGKLLQDAGER